MADSPVPRGRTRPTAVWALILGTGFLAVTALFGGLNLVRDPTGASIDLVIPVDLSHLAGTPFADYLIPGVVLVVCLGLYPLVVLYGQVTRSPWAWVASGAMAVILLGWLAVEVALIGYISPLQPAYGVFGLALIALLAAPTVRAHFDATVGT